MIGMISVLRFPDISLEIYTVPHPVSLRLALE